MKKSQKKVVTSKGAPVFLTDADYKAAGGQGVVYCKNGLAYKIYHDPKTMIPVAKIEELSVLKDAHILSPLEPLYDDLHAPIGFTMKFVDGAEYFCKIFTRTFRDDNDIDPQDVADLVQQMRKRLIYIHSKKILVVDYNEMNFLLSKDFKQVLHIDVDSWKTPSYPALALMESVRDRKISKGAFTEMSDWFSFAVVTFQMYVGIHPYKGFHPKYTPAEWSKRMDQGISVFDKQVQLPASCQDFSIIPKKHLEWYKEIFVKGDRSLPPDLEAVAVAVTGPRKVVWDKNKQVQVDLDMTCPDKIRAVYFFDQKPYVVTESSIHSDQYVVTESPVHSGQYVMKFSKGQKVVLCDVPQQKSLIGWYDGGHKIVFRNFDGKTIGEVEASGVFPANGLVYTISNGELIENSFEVLGKMIHRTQVLSSICPSHQVFRGMVVQDDFMTCHLAIPYAPGLCANIHVKELDGYRVIDAKHEGMTSVLVVEKAGNYSLWVLCFDQSFSRYESWQEKLDAPIPANMVALPTGINLLVTENKLTLFKSPKQKKEIESDSVDVQDRFYHSGSTVYFSHENKLYKIRML